MKAHTALLKIQTQEEHLNAAVTRAICKAQQHDADGNELWGRILLGEESLREQAQRHDADGAQLWWEVAGRERDLADYYGGLLAQWESSPFCSRQERQNFVELYQLALRGMTQAVSRAMFLEPPSSCLVAVTTVENCSTNANE